MSFCLSVSVCLSVCPFLPTSLRLSIFLCLFVFVFLSLSVSVFLSLSLSLCLSLCVCLSLSFSLSPLLPLPLFPISFPLSLAYEDQIVAFFRQPNVLEKISQKYARGIRPQLREVVEDIRQNGIQAVERAQLSGRVVAYELTIILR